MHKTTFDFGDRKLIKKLQGYLEDGSAAEYYHFDDGTFLLISDGEDGKPKFSSNRTMQPIKTNGQIKNIIIT